MLGDSAFETYNLIDQTLEQGLIPLYKPTKRNVRKKLSAKARLRKCWNGNHSRFYKEIRGTGEVLYGGATRCGLIHTNSIREDNRQKDALLIGLRQNLFAYLRLKVLWELLEKLGFKDIFYIIFGIVYKNSFINFIQECPVLLENISFTNQLLGIINRK